MNIQKNLWKANCGASYHIEGKMYRACVHSLLIYGTQTWAMKAVICIVERGRNWCFQNKWCLKSCALGKYVFFSTVCVWIKSFIVYSVQVKIWNTFNSFCFVTLSDSHTAAVTGVAFTPNGQAVVSSSLDGTCRAVSLVGWVCHISISIMQQQIVFVISQD